jgi:serine/threonine-protein kinase
METPTLSPDGNRIAFSLGDDLWVYDLQRKMRTQVTTGIGAAGPVWTPDGRFILFSTYDNIAWIPADGGSEPKLLLAAKSSVVRYPTSIYETTHDRRLAFMQNDVGDNQSWDLWTVPVAIDSAGLHASEPEPFLRTKFDERHLTFSRDGRWVAYSSNESGARHEIYVRRFPSDGRRWKVSDSGGIVPQWSSDRRKLFFQSLDRLLMVAPYSATANAFIPGEPRAWSEQPLLETFGPRVYSVSRDGTRVAALIPDATSQAQSRHVVTLWTNVLEEFRRRSSIQQPH